MIKLVLISFLLTGCANTSVSYSYFDYLRNYIYPQSIDLDSAAKEIDYSYIRASLGRNEALLVLSESKEGINTWVGANGEIIRTYNGLIVETIGLDRNFKILGTNGFNFLSREKIINVNFSLDNPDLVFGNLVLELEKIDDYENGVKYFYSRKSPSLGWSDKDIYVFQNEKIKYSEQRFHPYSKKIKLEFFFKYQKKGA